MDPENEPSVSPASPFVRWVIVPVAFSWVGGMLTAPLALINATFVAVGLILGLGTGFWVSWKHPQWVARATKKSPVPREAKPVSVTERIVLTTLSVGCATLVTWATLGDVKREGIAFFLAMFLMISFSRKALRRAWGANGSIAGMLGCGCLLFLLVRCSLPDLKADPTMTVLITIPLVLIEAFDEFRAMARIAR